MLVGHVWHDWGPRKEVVEQGGRGTDGRLGTHMRTENMSKHMEDEVNWLSQ